MESLFNVLILIKSKWNLLVKNCQICGHCLKRVSSDVPNLYNKSCKAMNGKAMYDQLKNKQNDFKPYDSMNV